MKKPLRTFEARKAQAFIVNFFVISLAIGMINLYVFMASAPCPVQGEYDSETRAVKTDSPEWKCDAAQQYGPFNSYSRNPVAPAVLFPVEACADDGSVDGTCDTSSFTAGTTVQDATAASCGAGCVHAAYGAWRSDTAKKAFDTPLRTILPSEGTAASIVGMIGSPVTAFSLVIVYMTKYVLEKRHRKATMEFGATKEADMQEQIDLAAVQLKKKDARIQYFEKQRDRAKGG
jgi:hypothetical protein